MDVFPKFIVERDPELGDCLVVAIIKFGDEPFENCKTLTHRLAPLEATPGWYDNDAWHGPSTIWLCHVTEFVFGKYPDKIYINLHISLGFFPIPLWIRLFYIIDAIIVLTNLGIIIWSDNKK